MIPFIQGHVELSIGFVLKGNTIWKGSFLNYTCFKIMLNEYIVFMLNVLIAITYLITAYLGELFLETFSLVLRSN